jgi:hypothetical protein
MVTTHYLIEELVDALAAARETDFCFSYRSRAGRGGLLARSLSGASPGSGGGLAPPSN